MKFILAAFAAVLLWFGHAAPAQAVPLASSASAAVSGQLTGERGIIEVQRRNGRRGGARFRRPRGGRGAARARGRRAGGRTVRRRGSAARTRRGRANVRTARRPRGARAVRRTRPGARTVRRNRRVNTRRAQNRRVARRAGRRAGRRVARRDVARNTRRRAANRYYRGGRWYRGRPVWRGAGRYYRGRYWRPAASGWYYWYNNAWLWAPTFGVVVATAPLYTEPAYRYARMEPWSDEWFVYCSRRYRSFEPDTGYYTTYSGRRRFCVFVG